MKITTTGKSLLELREIYGTGPNTFYGNSWWLKEDFAKEQPEAREYEIDFTKKLTSMTWSEQVKALPQDQEPVHVAVLAEAVLAHFKTTDKKLLDGWYSRTSCVDADAYRVGLGWSGGELSVDYRWDVYAYPCIGLASARKFKSEPRPLELIVPFDSLAPLISAIDKLTEAVKKLNKGDE